MLTFDNGIGSKAVQGGLAGVMHFLEWENSLVAGAAPLRVAWLARPSFDASLRDIFLPLLYGGTLFCPDAATRENPAALARWISKSGINVLHAVPSVFRLLAEAWRDGGAVLPELRWVLLAGEALTGAEIGRWRSLAPIAKFVNLYGPTETTMVKTFSVLDGPLPAGVLAVGRAIPGTRVYVVDVGESAGDEDGSLAAVLRAPRGVWGEVWLAGAGVTAGYFGDPAETARRFVSDPFGGAEARAYRTGDLGRWRDDGQLEIFGRLDRQVKIHGVRVDPEETRRALLALPGVTEAAVVAVDSMDDGVPGKALAAYFTGSASAVTLRDGLRSRLPAAFLPRYITCLPSLPLTRTGKVDVTRLPPPATLPERPAASDAEGVGVELSPIALRLQGIFAEVLGMPSAQVPLSSSFFALGGHSLAAMRLIGKIHSAFGVSLAMADIFRFDSVAALSGHMEERTFAAPPEADFSPAEEIVVLTPEERAELGL